MVGRNWCVFGCPCDKKNKTRTQRCGRGESFTCAMVARFEMKFASKKIAEKMRWARGVDGASGEKKNFFFFGKPMVCIVNMYAGLFGRGARVLWLRDRVENLWLDFVWQESRWRNLASFGGMRWGGDFFGVGMRMQCSWGVGGEIWVLVRGRAGSESWGERKNLNSDGRVLRE